MGRNILAAVRAVNVGWRGADTDKSMKMHLLQGAGQNLIRGYGDGAVRINDTHFSHSVIVMPDRLVTDWPPQTFAALSPAHFAAIAQLQPEVVLLGTGARLQFPQAALARALTEAQIGMEVMDTAAACRTYNILMAEGRRVAAALLI